MTELYTKLLYNIDALRHYLSTTLIDPIVLNSKLSIIDQIVEEFIHSKNSIDPSDFISKHQVSLYKVYDTLVGTYKTLYFKDKSTYVNKARSVNDKFFRSGLNIKNPKQRFSHIPTVLATGFCKAITYFKTNNGLNMKPFYHRFESCGVKHLTIDEKFKINLSNSELTIAEKKTYVKNCYIERLIYDDIYLKIIHEQDPGHLYELNAVSRLYQDYFPNESITVKVSYKDDYYPIKLTIITIIDDKVDLQYYSKSKYDSNASECTRIAGNLKYEKTQTFDEETAWIST